MPASRASPPRLTGCAAGCDPRLPARLRRPPDLRRHPPDSARPDRRAAPHCGDHAGDPGGRGSGARRLARRPRHRNAARRLVLDAPRDPVHQAVPLERLAAWTAARGRRRAGRLREDGAGRRAVQAAARPLRPRGDHQRHLHPGGCGFLTRSGRARRNASPASRPAAARIPRSARMPRSTSPRSSACDETFPRLDLVFIESGGDNLAATFSPELADLTIYVIDVAAGDKIPRKAGQASPLGPAGDQQDRSGTSVGRRSRRHGGDARRMRGERPFVFTNIRAGDEVREVADFIQEAGGLGALTG